MIQFPPLPAIIVAACHYTACPERTTADLETPPLILLQTYKLTILLEELLSRFWTTSALVQSKIILHEEI